MLRPGLGRWLGPVARRRLARYALAVFAALALGQGLRVWQAGGRDVVLSYRAPPGVLRVSVRDAEARLVLRVELAASAERSQAVRLPDGSYRARMEVGDQRVERRFEVRGEGSIEVSWW